MGCHTPRRFPYTTPPELRGAGGRLYPVVIVGAGPVGLSAAIDLAQHGIHCIVLDDNDVVWMAASHRSVVGAEQDQSLNSNLMRNG